MCSIHTVRGTPFSGGGGGDDGGGGGCDLLTIATQPLAVTNSVPLGHVVSTFAAHAWPSHVEPEGQTTVVAGCEGEGDAFAHAPHASVNASAARFTDATE
jgi:hypothetical protein